MLAATSNPSHLPGETFRGHALAVEAVRQSRGVLRVPIRDPSAAIERTSRAGRPRACARKGSRDERPDRRRWMQAAPPRRPTRSEARSLAAATPGSQQARGSGEDGGISRGHEACPQIVRAQALAGVGDHARRSLAFRPDPPDRVSLGPVAFDVTPLADLPEDPAGQRRGCSQQWRRAAQAGADAPHDRRRGGSLRRGGVRGSRPASAS